MPRFPPRGPRGRSFPRFCGTIKALRLPAGPPAALRCLRLAVPREHAWFAPAADACGRRRARGCSPGIPLRVFFRGDGRISQVPGEPRFPFAHVLRPRPADASLTMAGRSRGPRAGNDEGADDNRLSRLNSMASGVAAYVSRDGYPPNRARLASRCRSRSPGRASTRRAPMKGFQLTSCALSSFPKLLGTIPVSTR
jgi:hypothetical protein